MNKYLSILKVAFNALRANKFRSFLTILGIVIGIASVISLVSLGEGSKKSISDQVKSLGQNLITISPSSGNSRYGPPSTFALSSSLKLDEEIETIFSNKKIYPDIQSVSPIISSTSEVEYKSKNKNLSILGVKSNYFRLNNLNIDKGDYFEQNQDNKSQKIAIVGFGISELMFNNASPLGKEIKINNDYFTIIGIIEEKNPAQDLRIYIPINTSRQFIEKSEGYSQIQIEVKAENSIQNVTDQIKNRLKKFYKITNDEDLNFSVTNSKDLLSLTEQITDIFTSLLAGIAAISLLVGGIGIMNIMLVNVSERTKEIGLRKAVGAKINDILIQFLIEAVILTLLGGILGIILGMLMAWGIGSIADIQPSITLETIFMASGVSTAIGIIFGYYPARRASMLSPIDALRSE